MNLRNLYLSNNSDLESWPLLTGKGSCCPKASQTSLFRVKRPEESKVQEKHGQKGREHFTPALPAFILTEPETCLPNSVFSLGHRATPSSAHFSLALPVGPPPLPCARGHGTSDHPGPTGGHGCTPLIRGSTLLPSFRHQPYRNFSYGPHHSPVDSSLPWADSILQTTPEGRRACVSLNSKPISEFVGNPGILQPII